MYINSWSFAICSIMLNDNPDLVLTHDFVRHADPGLFAIVPGMHAGQRVNRGRHRHITLAVLDRYSAHGAAFLGL